MLSYWIIVHHSIALTENNCMLYLVRRISIKNIVNIVMFKLKLIVKTLFLLFSSRFTFAVSTKIEKVYIRVMKIHNAS